MNSNLSCERYIGRLKLTLEGGKVKDVDDLQIVDKRLRGYLALAYCTIQSMKLLTIRATIEIYIIQIVLCSSML